MHHLDRSCVIVGIFLKLLRSTTAYCPDLRCMPQAGMGKIVAAASRCELGGEREMVFRCVSLERSDLSFIGTREEGERAATGGEAKEGDEANSLQPKRCVVRIQSPL